MAVPGPPEVPMPVGYRFHPTDQEIIGHYLRHKLLADDPSINHIIPEIGVCKYEPWVLLDWAASAAPSLMNFNAFSLLLAIITTLIALGPAETGPGN